MKNQWIKVPEPEVDKRRDDHTRGLIDLRWLGGSWWWRERHIVNVDAPIRQTNDPTAADIRDSGPIARTAEGSYVNQYKECSDCGEQFLIKTSHERDSPRHKEYLRGNMEVSVPPQPLNTAFQAGAPTPPLEFGKVILCGRCKAKDKKGQEYYPDRDSTEANRFPCKRCLGHGVVPNVGPT